jgi:hypothetical protein
MPASKYDIYAEQGSTLKLHLQYKTRAGVGINLSGFTGEMQIRRSVGDPQVVLRISSNGVWGGGTAGEFLLTDGGITGVGGITFGIGVTGASGITGGIMITVDRHTMSSVPEGKHFYDFTITNTIGESQRLIEGMFEVSPSVTRQT